MKNKTSLIKCAAVIAALLCSMQVPTRAITVVDAQNKQPISSAAVFNNKGSIIGFTDADGIFSADTPSDFPLNIQCLGYEYGKASSNDMTVEMAQRSYKLPEVTVKPESKDIMRVVCYQRSFITAKYEDKCNSTIEEGFFDIFIPLNEKLKKMKGLNKRRTLKTHRYMCFTKKNDTDSFAYNTKPGNMHELSTEMAGLKPETDIVEPESLQQLESGTAGYYKKPYGTIVCTKTPQTFQTETDYVKEHIKPGKNCYSPNVLKSLGATTDFYKYTGKTIFRTNSKHSYGYQDIIISSCSFVMDLRGKWFKRILNTDDTIKVKGFDEVYCADIEYYTADEFTQMTSEKKIPPYRKDIPENVQPLDPAQQRIVDRCNQIRMLQKDTPTDKNE
ncbi:MAG: hypothetical protein ACI31A_09260 [Candidatus Limisoma sp.]